MKSIRKITIGLVLGLLIMAFASCKKDSDTAPVVKADLKVNKVNDLHPPLDAISGLPKGTVNYSLALNKEVKSTEAWDISFSTTTIATSGSVQLADGIFSSYTTAPTSGYVVGNVANWYTYTGTTSVPNHAIFPVSGKIILIKTTDSKYAKVEMISYYKGNPNTSTAAFADLATRPASSYYTFQFAYQADGTTNLK